MRLRNILVGVLMLILNINCAFSSDKLVFSSIEKSSFTNFAMSVLSEAYKRIGIDIETYPLPAKRSLRSANEGINYDGELFRISGIENEYTNLIPIKIPLHQSKWMVFTKNKKIEVNGWQSLKQYKLGIRRGIATTKKGTEELGFNTYSVNTNKQLFELLERNRVDAVIISKGNAQKALKNSDFKDIVMLENPVQVNNVYHFVHTKNKQLIPQIYKSLKKLETEGFIARMKKESMFVQ